MANSQWVTIARYSFPHEAHLAKALLDSENIPTFIADEHTINMQWLYSDALGGVRLQVLDPFVQQAKELLTTDFSDQLVDTEVEESTCSQCGSANISPYTKGKKPAFVSFILLGFPLFFYKHGVICKDCGEFSDT